MIKVISTMLLFCTITFGQYSTYDLIVEYEQECFNDSSLQHTFNPNWYEWNNCYEQRGNMASGYYYELICKDSLHYSYTHKEPDWDGFREFVKKKYQTLAQPK